MKRVIVFLVLFMLLLNVTSFAIASSDYSEDDSNSGSESDNSGSDSDDDRDDDSDDSSNRDDDLDDSDEKDFGRDDDSNDRDSDDEERENKDDDLEEDDSELSGRSVSRSRYEERRRFVDANGEVQEVRVEIEERVREDGRVERKVKYKTEDGEDHEIESEIEIEEEDENGEVRFKAKLSDGSEKEVKVLPQQASEIAREQFISRDIEIEIRERTDRNVPQVVYYIESGKEGRFLGVFKLRMRVDGEIDAETGELIELNKPWWAFLVAEPDSLEDVPITSE